jgi:uncharacterized protein YjiS (DUF1127 family)
MNSNQYFRKTANAGDGTADVPFYEFVQPNLYVGEVVSSLLWTGVSTAARAVAAFRRWQWERVTRQTLEGLDNRILADIGVTRSEIPTVARTAAEFPTFNVSPRSRWRV